MGNTASAKQIEKVLDAVASEKALMTDETQQHSVPIGNWTQYIKNALTGNGSFSKFIIGKSGGGLEEPAEPGCDKAFTASYQCGTGKTKLINIDSGARGQTVEFDCRDEVEKCDGFKMSLGDDGNIVLTNSKNTQVWTSNTNNTGIALDKYKAVNGKYKRNYLKSGEVLELNEFIGSPSGNCYLQMVKKQDGNAGLELRYTTTDCGGENGTTVGFGDSRFSNGLYSIPKININNLGKIGYVNDSSELREYPSNMVSYSNNYSSMGKYNNFGNDISKSTNMTAQACQDKCNSDATCAGYVFDSNGGICNTKSAGMFPFSNRTPSETAELYVRGKGVANSASCAKNVDVSTALEWELLPPGEKMSPDTLCGLGLITENDRASLDEANKELRGITGILENKLRNLSKEDAQLVKSLGYNVNKLQSDLKSYNMVDKKARHHDSQFSLAAAMNEDAESNLKSENFHYLLWSILAILIIIGGIRVARM